jgi:hypothetical protein
VFFFYSGESAPAITRNSPLSDVVSGVVFDLDATITASYDGTSQVWENLVVTPADGSAQAAYDFNRGLNNSASTDDPTFNGTAGDPAAYWSFDGGDFFTSVGGLTTFMQNLHRTDATQPFTVGYVIRTPAAGNLGALSTMPSTEVNGALFQARTAVSANQFYLRGATGGTLAQFTPVSGSTDYLVIFSFDPATNTLRRWINAATNTSSSYTKNTSTADSLSTRMVIGATFTNVSGPAASGSQIKTVFMMNTFIDDTTAGTIIDQLELRHDRSYV